MTAFLASLPVGPLGQRNRKPYRYAHCKNLHELVGQRENKDE